MGLEEGERRGVGLEGVESEEERGVQLRLN